MTGVYPYLSDVVNAIFGTRWQVPIPMFGVFTALAIAASVWLACREVERLERSAQLPPLTHKTLGDIFTVSILMGLIGARVFHILEYPGQFLADPVALIFTRSGFSIYGGLCFGVAAGIMLLRRRAVPVVPMLDAIAPALALGYVIGRIGCQVAGDGDWGIAADMTLKPHWLPDWLWAQTYTGNILGEVIAPPGVYPTPVYESAMTVLVLCALWALRSGKYQPGFVFSMYLLLMGFERLLIEKIRINAAYHAFGLVFTQAEAISLSLIVGGFIGVLVSRRAARVLPKVVFSTLVLAALSACVRH